MGVITRTVGTYDLVLRRPERHLITYLAIHRCRRSPLSDACRKDCSAQICEATVSKKLQCRL